MTLSHLLSALEKLEFHRKKRQNIKLMAKISRSRKGVKKFFVSLKIWKYPNQKKLEAQILDLSKNIKIF